MDKSGTDARTHGRTDARTHGRSGDYMLPRNSSGSIINHDRRTALERSVRSISLEDVGGGAGGRGEGLESILRG